MTDIAAVLFDFGGVIIEGPFGVFADLAQRSGGPADAVRQINSRNPDTNAWARAERGELDVAGFADGFASEAQELGFTLPAQEIIDVLAAMSPSRSTAVPAMLDVIADCRERGLHIGMITNNVRSMHEQPDADWVFDEFDVVIESCVVGTRKPEQAIYRLALEALEAAPEQVVMLDDLGINLKTARALGMATIKVVDPPAAAAELRTLIGA